MSEQDQSTPDTNPTSTGPHSSSEPVFLVAGRLHRPHGIHGEIEFEIMTDFPERLRSGTTVYVGDQKKPMLITHRRPKDQALLFTFEGIHLREEVGLLRNQLVYILKEGLPSLPEGEYYHHQLIGMQVFDESGNLVGTLNEIMETGANDVYLVRSITGEEVLYPAVADVILSVDPDKKVMVVRPQAWE
ncbi:MAG: ribosome maturation factor RimM [Anaerolineaceae bacterium]|nr:ribosome maturation factor RimM [Anaerolineaceae bacterium]